MHASTKLKARRPVRMPAILRCLLMAMALAMPLAHGRALAQDIVAGEADHLQMAYEHNRTVATTALQCLLAAMHLLQLLADRTEAHPQLQLLSLERVFGMSRRACPQIHPRAGMKTG